MSPNGKSKELDIKPPKKDMDDEYPSFLSESDMIYKNAIIVLNTIYNEDPE